jgi:hypothetical protein
VQQQLVCYLHSASAVWHACHKHTRQQWNHPDTRCIVFAAFSSHTLLLLKPKTVRNSPSSFYLYRVFNLGYNFIVFFVNMFIVFLMMGAFLWLVVAYGANLSIKGGVL